MPPPTSFRQTSRWQVSAVTKSHLCSGDHPLHSLTGYFIKPSLQSDCAVAFNQRGPPIARGGCGGLFFFFIYYYLKAARILLSATYGRLVRAPYCLRRGGRGGESNQKHPTKLSRQAEEKTRLRGCLVRGAPGKSRGCPGGFHGWEQWRGVMRHDGILRPGCPPSPLLWTLRQRLYFSKNPGSAPKKPHGVQGPSAMRMRMAAWPWGRHGGGIDMAGTPRAKPEVGRGNALEASSSSTPERRRHISRWGRKGQGARCSSWFLFISQPGRAAVGDLGTF